MLTADDMDEAVSGIIRMIMGAANQSRTGTSPRMGDAGQSTPSFARKVYGAGIQNSRNPS